MNEGTLIVSPSLDQVVEGAERTQGPLMVITEGGEGPKPKANHSGVIVCVCPSQTLLCSLESGSKEHLGQHYEKRSQTGWELGTGSQRRGGPLHALDLP